MRSALDGARRLSGGRLPKWSPALPRAARFRPSARQRAPEARRARRLFSELCGPYHGRAARRRRRSVAAGRRAAVPQGRLRRRLSGGAGGPVLRPAVREQGPRGGGRSQIGGARSGAARRQREWPLADRVRHEPVRLPDEAVLRRAASRARQHRVHPRRGAAARDARAGPRAGRHPSGMQRAQDGHRRQARRDRAPMQPRRRRGPRRPLLRIRGRQGLRPSGAQRVRAAAPEGRAAPRCTHGYSSSRTCEIGLSEQAGFPYRSIIQLVETCASEVAARGGVHEGAS